jgi:hypothetical protein
MYSVPGHVPMDVGYAAISLFVVVMGGFWFMPQYRSHFVRGGLYVGSAFLMYMGEQSGMSGHLAHLCHAQYALGPDCASGVVEYALQSRESIPDDAAWII